MLKRHPKDTDTVRVSLTLPRTVVEQIDALADLEEANRSVTIADLLRQALKDS